MYGIGYTFFQSLHFYVNFNFEFRNSFPIPSNDQKILSRGDSTKFSLSIIQWISTKQTKIRSEFRKQTFLPLRNLKQIYCETSKNIQNLINFNLDYAKTKH